VNRDGYITIDEFKNWYKGTSNTEIDTEEKRKKVETIKK
jgi:hypothetical protein